MNLESDLLVASLCENACNLLYRYAEDFERLAIRAVAKSEDMVGCTS